MDNNNQLLQVLTREGVLIRVSVRYFRGTKKLKPEDLGLKEDSVSDRLISLGHKRLFPKDALSELALVEGRAHALVEANTFPFLNGLAHYLPNNRLREITGKLNEMEAEFWKAKSEFVKKYATVRQEAAEEWRKVAKKLTADPERLVAAIEAAFPTADRLDRFFGFEVQLFQIAVPERLGLDLVSLAEHQAVNTARENAAREAAAKIRNGVEAFVADCVATLRQQTAQLCQEMLQAIDTCQAGVNQKTLNRLLKWIEHFKQINFVNDRVMEQQLEAVRKELLTRTAEEYRDSRTARRNLVNGLTQLREQAAQLARQDVTELVQRFGELGRRKFNLAA